MRVALEKKAVLDLTVMRPGKACVFGEVKIVSHFLCLRGDRKERTWGREVGASHML